MKYCQGPDCHTYTTKDRIRGSKGDKHYETRKRSSMYYGNGNFCDQWCMYDWIDKHIEHGLDHFGRLHEPKRKDASNAWYKATKYHYNNGSDSSYTYFFVNDLLGERKLITQQQYQDDNIITPHNLSQ